MSTPRHHTEWLSLLEISGPFLSLPVLLQAFPQGLDAHDPEHLRFLRLAYEEWLDNQQGLKPEPAIHRAWVAFVLSKTLDLPQEVVLSGQGIPQGLQAKVEEHQEVLRPDWVVVNPKGTPDAGKPRMLVQLYPAGQDLEKPLSGSRWKASPAMRMMTLLHACNVRLGLVTNGEQWMLVNAPKGETTGYISWYANLWLEEHLTLRSFRSLLGVRRFFGVGDPETLESLLTQSASSQQEVTEQLGYQVRKAVEVLIQALDKIDQDRDRKLLKGISESNLYEAALTLMMRLVFLFSAEERNLLLLDDPTYSQFYAVSTLGTQLREVADKQGEEILQYRCDAWCRLLATFRAVHGGIQHDVITLKAYGGRLFDPDRFPFLEGRAVSTSWRNTPANPIPVNNRTVLHLLEALQILQVKVPGGGTESRKVSFRALDIEQIGHVYEGLLDRTAVKATSPILGLKGSKDKEPEIPLQVLEEHFTKGEKEFIKFLKAETGRSEAALKKDLAKELAFQEEQRFLVACNNDAKLWNRVYKFAGLIRPDTMDYPLVIPQGSIYVTEGTDRRSSGTHYTPRTLTEPIVQYTLEPLVYEGVAEGKPKDQWKLKSAKELLELKICDMAMGSGAFLVQACRYLSERLVEAWEVAEKANPGKVVIAPEGTLSQPSIEEYLIPRDTNERLTLARRFISDRCLYGVDKNPMAVEMAKLSLWLVTLQKDRAFTFLDHALRCGDSLLGVTDIRQIEYFDLNPEAGKSYQMPLVSTKCTPLLKEAIAKRKELESFTVNDIHDLQRKEELLQEAELALDQVRFIGDLLVGKGLVQSVTKEDDADELALQVTHALEINGEERRWEIDALRAKAQRMLDLGKPTEHPSRKTFHWALEFPEVFVEEPPKGFFALVGNPPFQGGQKITGTLGTDYRDFLVEEIARGKRGSADLCAYFFLRAQQILNTQGGFGLLATNTIAQGDTREVALDQLVANGCVIPRAVPSRKWPGEASLEVAHVWMRKSYWQAEFVLDEKLVSGITPLLAIPGKAEGKPYQLAANQDKSFQGSNILGLGFTMSPEEAQALIDKDSRNKDVLFPYLNGEDLNSRPDQSPSRWVINFKDWVLNAAHDDPKKPKGPPYAADYPDCLEIVREKVKPEREKNKDKQRREIWWRFTRPTVELYAVIANMKRVFVIPRVSKFLTVSASTTNIVASEATVVIVSECFSDFAIIQSTVHQFWTMQYQSSLETRGRYTPSDCFETFPFPTSTSSLKTIGDRYYTHRQNIMLARQEGLTKTYNRFHNPEETSVDIQQLRKLHVEMDNMVAAAYGWQDLDLGHGFHDTKQGLRYTISEPSRREVLDRLLQLNHDRYAEEVAQGLHDKGKKKSKAGGSKKPKVQAISGQMNLL
ncbi:MULTISPECIES: Eco57I restriction-modification methylase domain-containing protein [Nostocales]|uniref:site-specific DNA-methyltransferase (adenine-specific) n=2 Tax=Tolypothrix TaxID=111782 RepID=A0A0C1NB32_9CYAN